MSEQLESQFAARLKSVALRDAALASLTKRVAALRLEAQKAALEPYRLLIPFKDSSSALIGSSSFICGIMCELHDGPLTVFARPAKIGRYQVVIPTRFEEAA